jgi:DNA polymerase-1
MDSGGPTRKLVEDDFVVEGVRYPEGCNGCPYRESSTGFVGGDGPARASVLVCGEAPGKRELEQGKPFVGPAGQELNKLLSIAGINRSEVYISNACKCLPESKTPSGAQTAECVERHLVHEVDSHRFKYVLALGRIAQSVFGVPAARKSGPAHGYILDKGSYHLMSTWHPAYILRTQFIDAGEGPTKGKGITARVEAQHDMLKFRRFVEGDLPIENPPVDLADMDELFLDSPGEVALDIETKGLDKFNNEVVLFGASWRDSTGQIKMASIGYEKEKVERILRGPWNKIFHNINFDVGVMQHSCDIQTIPPFSCTQMTGSLLGSDLPKGLEFLARAHLNTQPWKWTADTDHRRYNGIDCWATLRLFEEMTKSNGLLEVDGMSSLYQRSVKALEQTVYAHMRGVRVNVTMMKAIRHVMQKKVEEAEERLNEILKQETGMLAINWNSPKQVQNLLYEKLGLPKQYTTSQGSRQRKLTANADALQVLSAQHAIPQSLRVFKLFGKYVSTYLNPNLLHDGKLHPEFLMDVATTGRFVSRGPNFQNQPRSGPIKSIYLPDRPECEKFVEVDFSQIEMRVMVHLSGEPALVKSYEEGLDIHTEIAQMVFEKDEVSKEERHMAKYIVYGLGYGRGAASVAQQYGWSISEAQSFIRSFARRFPVLWEWRREQVKQADRHRYLTNPYSRRRYFYGRNYETRAYNFIPQSTALDILVDGIARIAKETPWRQMIWVHDSYCLSVPETQLEDALHELPKILGTCSLGWPTPVDVAYGDNWGDAKEQHG